MLRSTGSQRVRHDWATEQQVQGASVTNQPLIPSSASNICELQFGENDLFKRLILLCPINHTFVWLPCPKYPLTE